MTQKKIDLLFHYTSISILQQQASMNTEMNNKCAVMDCGTGEVREELPMFLQEDDCGVLCLYDPRTEGWETLYDTCVECGAVWGECDCENATECKATATREQILRATELGLLQ